MRSHKLTSILKVLSQFEMYTYIEYCCILTHEKAFSFQSMLQLYSVLNMCWYCRNSPQLLTPIPEPPETIGFSSIRIMLSFYMEACATKVSCYFIFKCRWRLGHPDKHEIKISEYMARNWGNIYHGGPHIKCLLSAARNNLHTLST